MIDSALLLKIISFTLILIIGIISGIYPFWQKMRTKEGVDFPMGAAIAAGIFLGAGLLHMLGDSAKEFIQRGFEYPFPFLLAAMTFLLLLLLEHIIREQYHKNHNSSAIFAILATLMLSVHSFLEGAALGLSTSLAFILVILFAIVAHKWAASFALAIQINKSHLSMKAGILLFSIFVFMTPLGIITGNLVTTHLHQYPLLNPIFTALAAGTFIYLGTLHGLKESVLVNQCCNLKLYNLVLLGFAIMAVVAIWT